MKTLRQLGTKLQLTATQHNWTCWQQHTAAMGWRLERGQQNQYWLFDVADAE